MSSVDTSGIDPTKPVQGNPLTANMRTNFAAIITQLENAGLDIDTINTFLSGIDSDSTNDQTGAEIKAVYEAEVNAFTDSLFTKLATIETSAKDDQTKSEIDALILKGLATGYATLDAGAKIPTAQLPALALTDIFEVASEVAMVALTAQEGDIAVRSDENMTYAHNGGVAGTVADWTLLRTPTDVVLSVAGNTGVVTAAQLKTAYEALPNAFTDTLFTKLGTIETGAKDDQTASEVVTTPSGNIIAENVQAAITELDTEKAGLAGDNSYTGTAQYAAGEGIVFNGDVIGPDNLLDDYEKGDYPVALTPGTGTITLNVSYDTLSYVKVGSLCHIQGRILVSSISSPTGLLSMNLPLSSPALLDDSEFTACSIVFHEAVGTTGLGMVGRILSSSSVLDIRIQYAADIASNASSIGASTSLYFGFSYRTV